MFLKSFEKFLVYVTQQNCANAGLDKTERLMDLKNRTLPTEIEYYYEIGNIKKKVYIHKNVASYMEQLLAATPHKAPTIRPPAFHHENYPS